MKRGYPVSKGILVQMRLFIHVFRILFTIIHSNTYLEKGHVLKTKESLDEQMSILAKRFIDQNNINLHSPLILFNRDGKTILYGTGTTSDGWFIKLWVVAKHPKIVFATYQSERKSAEVKVCDSIIDSFRFAF